MTNPSEHSAGAQGQGAKNSMFGCLIMGLMLLVVLGSVAQMLTNRPNVKAILLVLVLAVVSILMFYQIIKGNDKDKSPVVRQLKLDYIDRVMMEYLGMDEAYIDENLDHRLKRSGERGEQQVTHALSWLPEADFTVFNQVYITAKGRGQQFDHLVVGHNGIFHVETKNHAGRITITPDGNWEITRTISGKQRTEGMENPLEQVRRHEIVLRDFVEELFGRQTVPLQEIVVIANPKSTLKGEQNSSFVILKRDKLLDFIINYGVPASLKPAERRKIVTEIQRQNNLDL
ncbi:MAG: nuclease-related domain-containing protein [Peptococcaceae bacterium]|nr:nuclease-related domain-containing protein [Peptococcaceae bacterium]